MNLTSINTIRELLARHGFTFTKSLGQNFLINPTVCPRMLPDSAEYAVEVGAGVGVLTKELAKTCKKVICIEIDRSLEPVLAETLADYPNIEIIWGDVMKLDLRALLAEKFPPGTDVVCCANLPYYITSPVIMRLLEERLPLKSITVMVQKEAALRLCAEPGGGSSAGARECGAVSVAVRYYSEPQKLFNVSRGSFMPAPNVDSAVIRLNVLGIPHPQVEDERFFFRIVRAAFSQRRKQLANPLSAELGLTKDAVKAALAAAGLNPAARAEELTLDEFISLYKELSP
jgi:16S rRNA (adenine1518-N6/adenine1519-N6)-dimethyltransferase